MKKTLFILAFCTSLFSLSAQDCVTIESILVDACTLGSGCQNSSAPTCNCEGKNEMFRFRIGDSDQNVADLQINWPNNAFQGICQDALTQQNTDELNETIEACGLLTEPVNGLLPAGSQVIVITSADMCTASNSFANLADTLIILYQCPGNFMGHFANFGTGLRTTTVSFGGSCSSTATYDRSLLVTQAGFPGAEDGATVDFPSDGPPIYYNDGCNAPVPADILNAGSDITACAGDAIALNGFVQGNFTDVFWSGGAGTFADPTDLNTIYTPGPEENESFVLTLNAEGCNGEVTDQLNVNIIGIQEPVISPEEPVSICPGESVNLTATGDGFFTWSNGQLGPEITVSEPGTYTVTLTNDCGETEASITIGASEAPQLEILPGNEAFICDGGSVTLEAVGNGAIEWSTEETTPTIIVNATGTYTATLTNSCGTTGESVTVEVLAPPTVSLNHAAELFLCEGAELVLSASGAGDFLWSTGADTPEITVSELGTYAVTLSNDCGSDEATVEVLFGGSMPVAEIEVIGNTTICPGESTILLAGGDGVFEWNNGSNAEDLEVFLPGTYTLSVTNDCGTDVAEIEIIQPTQPLVTIAQGNTVAVCGGEDVVLHAASTLPITWSNGVQGASITVSNPGLYYAWVSNNCGSDTAFVNVLSGNPIAAFTASADTGSAPLDVWFSNSTSNADNYSWLVNGNPVSNDTDLHYVFHEGGDYQVTLIATDSAGCSDTFSTVIQVSGCTPALFIPNTFTPNGDGINDLFKYTARCIEEYEMLVFNRWGVLLYTGSKGSPFWDGNNGHGSYVSDGVYIYTITYTDINGLTKERNGTVTIFR